MDGCSFMANRLGIACYVWSFLFRTSLLKNNNLFFYEGDYFDDTPWLPRVLSLADRVDSIDVKRYYYLIRKNSLVQSASNRSLVRKIEGHRFLVKELIRQKRAVGNYNASQWYDRMVSHCVLSLLSLVSQTDFENRKEYINELREVGAFPLSKSKFSAANTMKLSLINTSPTLFCQMIHLKSKKQ